MKPFTPDGDHFVARLEEVEVALLASLVEQLCGLLGDGEDTSPEDPFTRWAGELSAPDLLDRDDPVVRRLFPDAYGDDRGASEEFHRYTAADQRRARLDAAHVVLDDLAATREGRRKLQVEPAGVDAWLKTVNAVRLSLAVRLGIDAESDHDELEALPARDPRTYVLAVYDWLGYVLESLLAALHGERS